MDQETIPDVDRTAITGAGLISCYVDDFQKALQFYTETLGLTEWEGMGPHAGVFPLPDGPTLFVIGGKRGTAPAADAIRCTFAFRVASISMFAAKLRHAGAELMFDEPMQMNDETWWLQFRDPAGNLLEAIGGE